jgi:pilus assembly protein CpaE
MSRNAKMATADAMDIGQDMTLAGHDARDGRHDRARPIPRISIQAFCEEQHTASVIQEAAEDRRLSKTHVSVHMGGAGAAVAHYQESPTPNLIVIESSLDRADMLGQLDALAECCDAGTKVMIVGHVNDVVLYRELLKRGVSEYIVAPIEPIQFLESLSNLYNDPDSDPVGNIIAFIGSKGGVGSSTVCHNVAWAISEHLKTNVVVADLDLAFGTTGLDFNQDPPQGIFEALQSPERFDEMLLDRLLTKCSEHLSIFAAPAVLDREFDISADACDVVLDVVRQNVPIVAVDLPHIWTPWVRRILLQADQIVITAAPDLANLRNTKNLLEQLKTARNNDSMPQLVINMAKMPKRPEIDIAEFAGAVGIQPSQIIDFDAEHFGQASNNGQMIEELSGKAKAGAQFRELAMSLAHRRDAKVEKKPTGIKGAGSALAPLLAKLKFKR